MKYRSKYEFTTDFSTPNHVWTVIGRHLAIHLHISELKDHGPSGGIEYHYREPPEHMKDDAPSQDRCWLLKAPCWHDGSSMQVTDYWIPQWQKSPHDHARMLALLEIAMEKHQMTTIDLGSKVVLGN